VTFSYFSFDFLVLESNHDHSMCGVFFFLHLLQKKRNILAVHIAKQLSQKKHRSKIGAVHLTHVFGDARKVALLLTPPLDVDESFTEGKKNGKKGNKTKGDKDRDDKKRRRDEGNETKTKKKGNKLRFRIRLIFGVKNEQAPTKHHPEEYSSDEGDEEQGASSWNCWIPRTRLFPDRCNNRGAKLNSKDGHDNPASVDESTPHHTNALAEDIHLVSTTHLISSTLATLTTTGSNVTPTSSFHETLLLLKVWALQRGFLRGHDTFTTTTLALVLVYLYRTKAIGRRMGSIQAFTTFMKFWSEVDWLGESTLTSGNNMNAAKLLAHKMDKKAAFVIPEEGRNESQTISHCEQSRLYAKDVRDNGHSGAPKTLLDCYKAHYTTFSSPFSSIASQSHHDSPILLDPTMTINYLARLSPSFVKESKAEAHAALRLIHGQEREGASGAGAFRKLFLETNRFWTRYDAYVRIPLEVIPKIGCQSGGAGKKSKGHGGKTGREEAKVWGQDASDIGYDESVRRGVVGVLSRALGDRVTAIRVFSSGNGDIRSNVNVDSGNDIATKVVLDSDQCCAIPIRGGNATVGYAANVSDRAPTPSALPSNDEEPCLVVGLRIDPNASRRIVDRGPPAEDVEGSDAFVALWGEEHAQLRRFQDGAIVRAVVWNAPATSAQRASGHGLLRFAGEDRSMGGIVERVTQHIVHVQFTHVSKKGKNPKLVSFELRDVISLIDGVISTPQPSPYADSLALHKNVMSAFESLADFLRQNTVTSMDNISGKKVSALGLPLKIDEVEPLSPCLRYSALFPPVPHPLLGGAELDGDKRKISGVNEGSPVIIQIRFEGSSKWPSSMNAMGAAKCAMLIQLADGIEKMKKEGNRSAADDLDGFDGPIDVTPNYLDVGYRGYSFRIIVRADQELRMLRNLLNPTQEAVALRLSLINRHVRGSMHHSLIHSVHTRFPSASSVTRLAQRWVAAHMLSDMIPQEAIELLVAKIYTESSTNNNSKLLPADMPPSTVTAGFLKFLLLLHSHDWAREPLIVDPQNHISAYDRGLIQSQFNAVRGPDFIKGPAMYIISPADYDGVEEMTVSKIVGEAENTTAQSTLTEKIWAPTVTATFPEKVVLSRAAALAKCSYDHLTSCIMLGIKGTSWAAAFRESSSALTSYSALLRVDSAYITDSGCSSTNPDCGCIAGKRDDKSSIQSPFERSLQKRHAGPKDLRKKNFKNLNLENDTLHEWQPVKSLVSKLRSRYNDYALFFYNELTPDVIAMLWRPAAFVPQLFSAMVSEFKRPAMELWKNDSLVITNTDDLMSEIEYASKDIISDVKVLDDKKPDDVPTKGLKKSKVQDQEQSDSEYGSSDSE